MDIYSILPKPVKGQQAFIFDHGKIEDGTLKYKDDVTSYGWSTKRYNKVKPGAFVLNRHPGKITKDRKFEIYAGGYVEKIESIDDEGNVVATISHTFQIEPPIKQGDTFIENFEWDSKKKKEGTWEHFWNQYGMNSISLEDFENLLENVRCVPINNDNTSSMDNKEEITDEEIEDLKNEASEGFNVTFEEEGPTHKAKDHKITGIGRKIDFKKVQESRDKTGALGEQIVMDILSEKALKEGLKEPVHVSKEEGDGTGYDIRCWDAMNNEIHVEVKASKDRYADGFEMTRTEIEASKDTNYIYRIYRVYSLNLKTRECRIKVYDGPVTNEQYNLITKTVVVYQK